MGGPVGTDPLRTGFGPQPPLLDDADPTLFPKLTDGQLDLLAKRRAHAGTRHPAAPGPHRRAQRPDGPARGRDRRGPGGGSVLVVPADEFRALLGRELVFGDFVLQALFRRRQAIERLRMGIQIVGSRFDRDTHRLREFAARNRVLHTWVDIDEPRRERLLALLPADARESPIVLFGDGSWLRNPTNAELAARIGVPHAFVPAEKTYDLVVVGAGPAGLAATVYGGSGGLLTSTLDAVAVGGQAAPPPASRTTSAFPRDVGGRVGRAGQTPGPEVSCAHHGAVPRCRPHRARRFPCGRAGRRHGSARAHRHPRPRCPVSAAAGSAHRRLPGARGELRGRLGPRAAGSWRRGSGGRRCEFGGPGGALPRRGRATRVPRGASGRPRALDGAPSARPHRGGTSGRGAVRPRDSRDRR